MSQFQLFANCMNQWLCKITFKFVKQRSTILENCYYENGPNYYEMGSTDMDLENIRFDFQKPQNNEFISCLNQRLLY